MRMNKLWIFAGGCVAGVLGLLAAAAVADGGSTVATNAGEEDVETSAEEQEDVGEAVRAVD